MIPVSEMVSKNVKYPVNLTPEYFIIILIHHYMVSASGQSCGAASPEKST